MGWGADAESDAETGELLGDGAVSEAPLGIEPHVAWGAGQEAVGAGGAQQSSLMYVGTE